jgi:hypothetical protein
MIVWLEIDNKAAVRELLQHRKLDGIMPCRSTISVGR